MNRLYTRTGDKGTTAIHGGQRVAKFDPRIEANGSLDELNVSVGGIRVIIPDDDPRQDLLREIQMTLMSVMSLVATPSANRGDNPNKLSEDLVKMTEGEIDHYNALCTRADYFILPGGTAVSLAFHRARVDARRAERMLWQLNELDAVDEKILIFVNRLSDLFFVMARHEMETAGMDEERWKKFAYKRVRR